MIKKITFRKMSNTEFYDYLWQTIQTVKKSGPTEVAKSKLCTKLEEKFAIYDEGFKKDGKSMLTTPISLKDEDRDRAGKWLYFTIYSQTFSSDREVAEAATLLLSKFDTYGFAILRAPYGEESASIKSLLNDYKRGEYSVAAAKLPSIRVIMDELQGIQDEFDDLFTTRRTEEVDRSKVTSAYKLRSETEEVVEKFRTQISGMAVADEESEWAYVNGLLCQLDSEYQQKIRTRETNSDKDKEKEEKDPTS